MTAKPTSELERILANSEPTRLAWLAGFFDGDRCVTASKAGQRGIYQLRVVFIQKPFEVLAHIGGWLPGAYVDISKTTQVHSLRYTSMRGCVVLEAMLPYLVVKREVAELGIKLAHARPEARAPIMERISRMNRPGRYLGDKTNVEAYLNA